MTLAVVIGNHNGAGVLSDCLASIRAQTLAPEDIVVVDGESTDESAALAEDLGARVIRHRNLGLGVLYNLGVAATTADYVFLANNDIALDPACLERLHAAMERDTSTLAADARQLDWAGGQTIHARTTVTRGRLTREFLPGLHLDPNVPAARVTPTVCANGAAMLVRRSMFEELGGFDETFFMEWEDLDLCWRGWLRGFSTVYVPDAIVRHRVGAVTTDAVRPRRSASSHHNLVRFALKCLPAAAAARVVAGELIRLPAHPRAVAAGLAAVVRELPAIRRQRRRARPSVAVFRSLVEDPG
jgi:N-acetylglucosaminyl-diphospho-decaprenol L-rhamnosyltransferase